MIDGIRRARQSSGMRPIDRQHMQHLVVSDHTRSAESGMFRPPEAIAADESEQASTEHTAMPGGAPKKRRSFKEWLRHLSKKQWAIIIVVAVLVLGGGGFGTYKLLHHSKPAPKKVTTVQKPAPAVPKDTRVPSNLTGLPVDASVNQRPVTAAMIENSTFARPQSGLDQAGVVFEAVAEGGITRFEALFQDNTPDYIGPIRSVRPYYIQWGMGFDAAIAHVGGSPEALSDMKSWGAKDLDQFANGSYYHRISSRDAPHNVYTSLAELNNLESKKGYGASKFTSWERKGDAPLATPTAASIDLAISSSDYNVHYDYDKTYNIYKRSEGGQAHMAINKGGVQTQITPRVVVALVMQQGLEPDDHHTSYNTIGSGSMYVFQDGGVAQGTWHKTDNASNLTFTDASGQTLKLNAGQTWVTILGSSNYVSYK
jgi:DUF3048 family protein